MAQTAEKQGLSPMEWATKNATRFKEMDALLGVDYDRFIRTTDEDHIVSSQAIWQRMVETGDIYPGAYSGWYSVRDEAYFAEDETTVGDDGVRRSPQGAPVEWTEEKSYFFRLSAYQQKLLDYYDAHPDFIRPDVRRNEVTSFVRSGLQDLSISRTTFTWGIPVPGDEAHVMYVWVDALTNYITGVGYPDAESASFRRFWPADLHIIGKDIIRFHAVYWPAFLMSAGIAPPKTVFAHGFIHNRGEKMSKSVGNVIDPFDLAQAYGVDALRYFLLREIPFGQDGSYSHEAIVARTNADLANDLGNLAQRSLSMIAKNLGGTLPSHSGLYAQDVTILESAQALLHIVRLAMEGQQIHNALTAIWEVVAEANRYFAASAPWELRKTDQKRFDTVLWTTAEVIRRIAIIAQPFIPVGAGKLLDLLAVPTDARDFTTMSDAGRLTGGTVLPAPAPVFPRYVEPETASPA
jgi:methionyl-tRNA synthetase